MAIASVQDHFSSRAHLIFTSWGCSTSSSILDLTREANTYEKHYKRKELEIDKLKFGIKVVSPLGRLLYGWLVGVNVLEVQEIRYIAFSFSRVTRLKNEKVIFLVFPAIGETIS